MRLNVHVPNRRPTLIMLRKVYSSCQLFQCFRSLSHLTEEGKLVEKHHKAKFSLHEPLRVLPICDCFQKWEEKHKNTTN